MTEFYKSWSGYKDELCWAASWIYRATELEVHKKKAEGYYRSLQCQYASGPISWDDKSMIVQLHMAQLFPKNDDYRAIVEKSANELLFHAKTPKGLLFNEKISKWGSLRYAANWAFFLFGAARLDPPLERATDYLELAQGQLGYMLGDTGRSFVVGFGKNPPRQPHHRSSSCNPLVTADCASMGSDTSRPNAFTLFGALVGGPDSQDNYNDSRNDYIANEVAIDYNAGFQGAIAAWKCFAMDEQCWSKRDGR